MQPKKNTSGDPVARVLYEQPSMIRCQYPLVAAHRVSRTVRSISNPVSSCFHAFPVKFPRSGMFVFLYTQEKFFKQLDILILFMLYIILPLSIKWTVSPNYKCLEVISIKSPLLGYVTPDI
jgi:hypothetical protein